MNGAMHVGQGDFAAALLDAGRECPRGLRTWNGSDPNARFAVYRNNVLVSLVDALADTFPVCCELVGETFFRAMARVFVTDHPPRARVLAFYGREFPAFVSTFAPAASVPYLADVARLEMTRLEACHAADALPLPLSEIAAVLATPAQLPGLRVRLHPSVAVLRSKYAVHSLWAAHQGEGDLSAVDPMLAEAVLVLRAGFDVRCVLLDPASAVFIDDLVHGAELGAAHHAASLLDPAFDLAAALGLVLQHEIITARLTGDHDHEHTC
ncbi:putative DNA-binding domain-containing protein [Azoarcus sp. L1K30]|uniref:HvfC/BufC N-terminal domain-containing protein n=1 Tax=Azoarcus sp. L1K30 TaxID=2820277 RepID=UPI001B82817B|nr:DNA-binding domain-containing protein [Azoarcus sp. L1K30]MBR0568913.1 putative DNA-binding domain-containing protein [Azoarcus sp. L1K30]